MVTNIRARLLAVLEILRRYSNEKHILTASDIISKLNSQYGISADRRAIYEDIDEIINSGYDISTYSENGKGYYLREAEFEFSELRLLVDAILSARFISKSYSRKLINKIKKLTNVYDERRLERVNFINKRVKCDNASVFYTIDILSEAIEKGKQVKFKYLNYDINKDMVFRDNKERKVSPYGMIWVSDYYYLVARYSWLNSLTHFRIDKIKDIEVSEKDLHPVTELEEFKNGFNIADYTNKRVYMFGGKEERITLKCKNEILHDIIERFGSDTIITPEEEGYFTAIIKGVRKGLIYYVLQYGTNIEVIKTNDFRKEVTGIIEQMLKKYK